MLIDKVVMQLCPCGSGNMLVQCCAVYHAGKSAPTAEALMRSRYTAYVLGLHDYLWQTWHESTRPQREDLGGTSLRWIHLLIVAAKQGQADDTHGEVRFVASYVSNKKCRSLTEHSRFVRQDGQWFYVDGDCEVEEVSRNQACPCESGKKLKQCCMQLG